MAGTKIQLKDLNLTPYGTSGSDVAYSFNVERRDAYDDKETYFVDLHIACGVDATIDLNGLGPKNITIGGINVTAGELAASTYFLQYDLTNDRFVVVGGGSGGGGTSCADVKICIEGFTTLDLTNVDLTLGDVIFDSNAVINWNSSTSTGIQNFDDNYVANYDNSIINYNSTYTLIGCTGLSAVPLDDAINASATKADISVVYDNTATTPGDTRTKDVTITESSGLITIEDSANGHTGVMTVEWNIISGNIEVRQISGLGASTANVCQFSGGVIINNDGGIINNDNTITNNNGTTTNNNNSDEYYDETSTTTHMGDTYNENLNVNNLEVNHITIEGSNLAITGGWNFEQNLAVTTTITLAEAPADWDGVFILTDSGTLLFRGVDWTEAGNVITFVLDQGGNAIFAKYMPESSVSLQSGTGYKKLCDTAPAGGPGLLYTLLDAEVTANSIVNLYLDDAATPVGFITAKTIAGGVEIYSTQAEATSLDFCVLVFTSTPTVIGIQMIKGQGTRAGGLNTFVVSDPTITDDSMVDVYPKTAPAGNLTVVASAGQFVITTTASDEDGIVFNRKATL